MTEFCADIDMLFTEIPFDERFKAARAAGFSSVEFTLPDNFALGKLGDLCACDGLKPAVVSLPESAVALAFDKSTRKAFCDAFEKAADTADFIEAPFVHLPACALAEDKFDAALPVFVKALKDAAKIAKIAGVKILLSFKNPIENPDAFPASTAEAVDLLDELDDDKNFALLYDVYQAQTGEGGLSNALETLVDVIGHIRVAGAPLHQEPDDGEINYAYILSLLEAHGYAHAVSASYTPRLTTQAGLKWLKKFL